MTTTIKVEAHCAENIEVLVVVSSDHDDDTIYTLQNGEKGQYLVYDTRSISICEMPKNG